MVRSVFPITKNCMVIGYKLIKKSNQLKDLRVFVAVTKHERELEVKVNVIVESLEEAGPSARQLANRVAQGLVRGFCRLRTVVNQEYD